MLHLVPGQPDAVAFEQDLGRSRQLRKAGDAAGAVSALDSALSLWRGIAFGGVPGPFAETERVRLGELCARRRRRARRRAPVARPAREVVPDLTAMVADHPLRERMRGLLMVVLYRCGRRAEALRIFAEGRRVLAEELGIDPGSELSRIHQQVLTMDPGLAVPDGPAVITLDGEAAGAGPAPDGGQRRPRPEGRATPVPAQLPLDAPGFSGRREELSMLQAMLPAKRGGAEAAQQGSDQQDQPDQTVPIVVISARRGRGRPRSPSGSAIRSPSGSPAASCTSTCAVLTRPPRRWSRPRRCASSSTRWAYRRTGSRPTPSAGPRCSAACSTTGRC